ncbi:MAG: M48 family metallopeptidase [Planctomycetota bacterium]
MWDAIAANRRRSIMLILAMGVLLVVLGGVIGMAVDLATRSPTAQQVWSGFATIDEHGHFRPPPPQPVPAARSLGDELSDGWRGLLIGMGVALLIWLVLWLAAIGAGESILLSSAKAREIRKDDAPQLWNVVEEMSIAAGLPKMPRVCIIDDPSLNAFAVGRRPEKAAVAVTSGLLKRLNRDELQGVIAHEVGHIRNLDVRFMTLAAVMMGAIVLMAEVFLRGLWYSGGGRRRSSRDGGKGAALIMVAAIVLAIVAPLAAQLLYLASSRRREYLADASAARFTRYPLGLASALEKIAGQSGRLEVSKAVAPLCIVNPLHEGALIKLFSTHPPTQERIQILRKMGGAGFAAYEAAFRQLRGESKRCISETTLSQDDAVAIREAAAEEETPEAALQRAERVVGILDRVIALPIIACTCGLRMKIPPAFKAEQVRCPRCGRVHVVAAAVVGAVAQGTRAARPEPMHYRRQGSGWEAFECRCGHTLQISPKFQAPQVTCPKCGTVVRVESAAR